MKLKRYKNNPILEPTSNWWESRAVFNPAAVLKDKKVYLLYRAIGKHKNYAGYVSRFGLAISKDGENFKRKKQPVFTSKEEYEKWTCEDPRIVKLKKRFFITYTALGKPYGKGGWARAALASTLDFHNFKRHGTITERMANDKDVVLFPEQVNKRYVMLHRPFYWKKNRIYRTEKRVYIAIRRQLFEWPWRVKIPEYFPERPSVWISYSRNMIKWYGHKVILEPTKHRWESWKIGAGPPPIKTDKGWLVIYHGIERMARKKYCYSTGAALLDLQDPSKVIARTKEPILRPEEWYELEGDVPNVVFPSGAVIIRKRLYVYYGGADKYCCLATCKLKELVDFLLSQK